MQFYDYPTTRDLVNRGARLRHEQAEDFYKRNFGVALVELHSKACAFQMVCEHLWEKNRRPYYNVYPTIAPMLIKLNLNLDTSLLKLPMLAFCIRFSTERSPIHFTWEGEPWHIRSMLVGPTTVQSRTEVFDGFVLWLSTGEFGIAPDGSQYPVHSYINLPVTKGMTLEESLRRLPYDPSFCQGMILPDEIRTACVRLACTICLLGDDPELIEADVLNADRDKFEASHDGKYIEKAKRRGKVGFNVGKGIEVIPHFRRPHPALMWTGHGRTVPKVVLRKGSLIHREVIERVPTGFQQ